MISIHHRYQELIYEISTIISIKDPKPVRSERISEYIFNVYLSDVLIHTVDIEPLITDDKMWRNFALHVTVETFSSPHYINPTTILFYQDGYSPFYLLENGQLSSFYDSLCFINEQEMFYEHETCYGPMFSDTYHIKYCKFGEDVVDLGVHDIGLTGCFMDGGRKNIQVLEGVLRYELEKYFSIPFDEKRLSQDLPTLSQEENVSITINGEIYELKCLREFHSEFLNNLIDERKEGEDIYLPISKFDHSVECLHYLGSLLLEDVLFKSWLSKWD